MGDDKGICKEMASAIGDLPIFSWLRSTNAVQCVMFGLEGAGKTTLLYKLKIPQWKREDIQQDMKYLKRTDGGQPCGRDPAYHYEELSCALGKYGIWEVPGNETMLRQWPMFYRHVRMDAVLFVVDCYNDLSSEKLERSRYWLHYLLHENELRNAAFVVIVNVADDPHSGHRHSKDGLDEATKRKVQIVYEVLGCPEIEANELQARRLHKFACNCSDMHRRSKEWEATLTHIFRVRKENANAYE
eukprot:TRINITY_DN58638_c0_g2_i1.p1 TRINITY_DN58638_c0_g2~~TRINITY_DN58638_c0_g2_i1.p1  ORF type:complete len:244 (-),score=49.66 TRINITY_DN58638_c0_g2_i1:118-849(-)